ncbi:MAG: AMP-binding protein, partial [bacterium]|nr:AMP-binding protein [bacterium]
DVLFGATVAGRPAELPGVESMVGLFITTLPVRVEVKQGELLVPWLERLQNQQAELRSYEHSPLDQVQKWSGAPPGQPLFEHILVFENYPVDSSLRASLPGIEISEVRPLEQTNYPLTVFVTPGAELDLTMSYDRRRFEASAIRRMLGHFRELLQGFVADPRRRLSELPLLSGGERQQILHEWNDTAGELPGERCLHELFSEQVERTPEAVAVVCSSDRDEPVRALSYRELNRRADRLADTLCERGVVRPGVLVGICVERSPEMVVGLLGTLKAGGAYVPLDPSHPPERLAVVLEDMVLEDVGSPARPAVLLSQQHLVPTLPAFAGRLISLDDDLETLVRPRDDSPTVRVSPDELAYVIYTSGSTGRPKGVQISHRALVNFLHSMRRRPGLTADDVLMAVTTLSFDIAGLELYLPLLVGARVELASRGLAADGAALSRRLEAVGATVMQA